MRTLLRQHPSREQERGGNNSSMAVDSQQSTPSRSPARALKRLLFFRGGRKNNKTEEVPEVTILPTSLIDERGKVSIEQVVMALQNEAKKGELLEQYRELKETGSYDTSMTPVMKNNNNNLKMLTPRRKKKKKKGSSTPTDSETSEEDHPLVSTVTVSSRESSTGSKRRRKKKTLSILRSGNGGGGQAGIEQARSRPLLNNSMDTDDSVAPGDAQDSTLDPLGDSMISAVTLPPPLRKNVRFSKDVKRESSESLLDCSAEHLGCQRRPYRRRVREEFSLLDELTDLCYDATYFCRCIRQEVTSVPPTEIVTKTKLSSCLEDASGDYSEEAEHSHDSEDEEEEEEEYEKSYIRKNRPAYSEEPYTRKNRSTDSGERRSTDSGEHHIRKSRSTDSGEPHIRKSRSTDSGEPHIRKSRSTDSLEPRKTQSYERKHRFDRKISKSRSADSLGSAQLVSRMHHRHPEIRDSQALDESRSVNSAGDIPMIVSHETKKKKRHSRRRDVRKARSTDSADMDITSRGRRKKHHRHHIRKSRSADMIDDDDMHPYDENPSTEAYEF